MEEEERWKGIEKRSRRRRKISISDENKRDRWERRGEEKEED